MHVHMYTFAPKEMCRKHYIIEQISGSLHEIRLYNVHLIYISWYRKFNFFCSDVVMQYSIYSYKSHNIIALHTH